MSMQYVELIHNKDFRYNNLMAGRLRTLEVGDGFSHTFIWFIISVLLIIHFLKLNRTKGPSLDVTHHNRTALPT